MISLTRVGVTMRPRMLIPLGTDRPLRRPTLVTPVLLAVNVVVFLIQLALEHRVGEEAYWVALRPYMLNHWGQGFQWYQPASSAFLHADIWHIAGNMLFLWVFGQNIEDRFGRWWYLLFYTASAYAAGLAHSLLDQSPAIGASGAIAGLTGAYFVLFPRTQVRVVFLLFLSVFWVSAWWVIGLSVMWDVFASASRGDTGVAHLAHLGGGFFGMAVAMVLLWTRLLSREPYDLFSMGKQAYRRRQFKEAGLARERQVQAHWQRAKAEDERARARAKGGVDAAESSAADELSDLRGEVVRLLDADQPARLAEAYRRLMSRYGDKSSAVTLSFRQHEQLAIALYGSVDKQTAAFAIERLIEAYPKEQAMPRFKLLLGLLCARELNDPVRAKALLTEARERVTDQTERELAERELADLG